MSFRDSASELDALLAAARGDLATRNIAVADGSAPESEVWAFSFSTEVDTGFEKHRLACTLTLRGEAALTMQSIATSPRIQHRGQTRVEWPDLRRRGMAAMVEDALASAHYQLQVKIGADFSHQELIRRCESLLDLLGDDIPNVPTLRAQVGAWKTLAEQRSLYSAARRTLIEGLDFGHLQDDANALEEFYQDNIYKPLTQRGGQAPSPVRTGEAPVLHFASDVTARRVAILDRIPKAPPPAPESARSLLALGVALALVAVALIAFAVMRQSWVVGVGGAVFLFLVVRALRQWHA